MMEPSTDPRVPPSMRRLSPAMIALIAAGGIALLLVLYTFAGLRAGRNPDRLGDNSALAERAPDPAKRCASQATYDLIKRELFRRAAELRGSDQAAFDRLGSYAAVRMERPVLESDGGGSGPLACAGSLSLDLPPGVAVVGGRRSLNADIGYQLQRAADGSGDVLTLTGADAIITPLATLARTGQATADPLQSPAPQGTSGPPSVAPIAPSVPDYSRPAPPAPRAPAPPAPDTASPSFNCANARSRSEIAICASPSLAGLDRQMAAQFNGAVAGANSGERDLLQSTRSRFLNYRDGCRSDDCISDAYRGRMSEIRDIMAGRWRGPH